MCELLKKITSPDEQRILNIMGFSGQEVSGNLYIDNPHMIKIQEMLGFMSPVPNHPLWDKIEPVLQREIKKAILGEKTSSKALEDAKNEIEMLLD